MHFIGPLDPPYSHFLKEKQMSELMKDVDRY